MTCKQVALPETLPGDILVFKGDGLFFEVLGRIVKWKVPTWDRWGWHTAPVSKVSDKPYLRVEYLDAQFPKLKMNTIKPGDEVRVYRWLDAPPEQVQVDFWMADKVGCWYDWLVYFLTAFAILLRPKIDFPRVINRRYDCWETVWAFTGYFGRDLSEDYNYPFLTDLLKLAGEC